MRIIRQRAYARAGLVGNPSDGYHGKTISVLVRNFYAEVTLYEWEHLEILLSAEDKSRFGSIDELVQDVEQHGYYGGIRLVKATIKRFAEFCAQQREAGRSGFELSADCFSVRYKSTIPRQVGLAGSSAIIVATLRALMEFYLVSIPQHILPSLALSVERDELGIAAGLQDRVIQVYGGAVYMDFGLDRKMQDYGLEHYHYEPLKPELLPPLYLAFTKDRSEPTEAFHNPLRERYRRGESAVVDAMQGFASYAEAARQLLLAGDQDQLGELINKNFDLRQQISQLAPGHVRMIEMARRCGASAHYCGSGGAIIGTYPDEDTYRELEREFDALNCVVLKPQIETPW